MRRLLIFCAALPALSPGRYEVKWRAISTDSHKLQGRLRFELRP